MYNYRMQEVETVETYTHRQITDELLWWDRNLRKIPEWQLEGCTPPPNAPEDYLKRLPAYMRCTPRIYWELRKEAKKRELI